MNIIIDLNNIGYNIKKIKEVTNRKIIGVVKSNAYGLGERTIIKTLINNGVDYLFFNQLNEYKRNYNIVKNVNSLIFESLNLEEIKKVRNKNIIISVNCLNDMLEISNIDFSLRVHLQIDTGMNRYGIRTLDEYKNILDIANNNKNIIIEGIYTHYYTDLDEYYYFNKQQEIFKKYLNLFNFKIIHSNATSSLHKDIIGNYVRVGIGLYGYHNKIGLKPVLRGYTRILNIFEINKNEQVGYGLNYIAKENERIALLDIGYFDAKIINKVYYLDKSFKIIGKKCMNHSYIKADEIINLQSRMSIFEKYGIIEDNEYNYYHLLVSLNHLKKNYLLRNEDEVFNIFRRTRKKGRKTRIRKTSYSAFSNGIIKFKKS